MADETDETIITDEDIKELNIIEEDGLKENGVVALSGGLEIEGLEDVPGSILPVPFLKLVQPTSQNIDLSDGEEATTGSFYYTDTQESKPEIHFALLKAKHGPAQFERDGETINTTKVAILGYDLDNKKLFITSLSPTSFSPFGQLVAKMKEKEITKTWEYELVMKSEKTQNDKGKYWIVKFDLGKRLADETIEILNDLRKNYAETLEQRKEE